MIISYGTAWAKKIDEVRQKNGVLFPVLAGISFGAANLLNTLLAGRIDSAILFPI